MSTLTQAEKREREAAIRRWAERIEWVERNRYYIAGVTGAFAVAILWPRTPPATTPPPTPSPATPTPTMQAIDQSQKLFGFGLVVSVIAAGALYVSTNASSGVHAPAYSFVAPTPTRSVWSSWVSDW